MIVTFQRGDMVKKCRSCGKNRLIEFFFKQFMGKRGALTADR